MDRPVLVLLSWLVSVCCRQRARGRLCVRVCTCVGACVSSRGVCVYMGTNAFGGARCRLFDIITPLQPTRAYGYGYHMRHQSATGPRRPLVEHTCACLCVYECVRVCVCVCVCVRVRV